LGGLGITPQHCHEELKEVAVSDGNQKL
jgi:hypothetical protein